MKSSTVWRKVSLLLCVISLCCFRNGDSACDPFAQCELTYPDDNIRCSVHKQGNSRGSCFGIGSILYSCDCYGEGLTLNLPESNGRDSFTCTNSGTWDDEFSKLSCTACDKFIQCHLVYPDDNIRCSVLERGNCNSADSCYGIDSMLHSCHCNGEGLTLNLPESNGRDSFTCTRNATWDEEFSKLSCTAKPCDAPILWDNSLVVIPDQTSYAHGTEVTFRCVEGFELSGDTLSVVCNYGNWSSYQYPNCTAKPCDAPILWDNSLVVIPDQTSYANGTEVTFRCVEGFELSGDTLSVVCNYGNWSSYQYPNCTVRNCSRPILSDNHLRVSPDQESYFNGSEVNFECTDGFDLSTGNISTICLYGSWKTYTEPICRTKSCDPPVRGNNSLVLIPNQTSYANGTEVTFRCVEGFELSGDTRSVVCNCGNWSSYRYPNCTVKVYPKP